MKLVLDEWIIREVIDTLYMALTTLLGITGLDSPQEVAKKSSNETAITRRISKAIDIIQQSKQPEMDLEKEICEYFEGWRINYYSETEELLNNIGCAVDFDDVKDIARHFYELGLNARKEQI